MERDYEAEGTFRKIKVKVKGQNLESQLDLDMLRINKRTHSDYVLPFD